MGDPQHLRQKEFHIFVSYRVSADGELAERITDKLQIFKLPSEKSTQVKCFLDKQNLTPGENYEQDLLSCLGRSCLFLPLVSSEGLSKIKRIKANEIDNLLREYEEALRLREKAEIFICPLFVGTTSNGTYKRFEDFDINAFPEVRSGTCTERSVRETMKQLFHVQGLFVNPLEIRDKLPGIVNNLSTDVWPNFRARWHNRSELEPERMFNCVQCKQGFLQSENGEGSCAFHTAELQGRKRSCCSDPNSEGCVREYKHRSEHHQDYRYEAFISWGGPLLRTAHVKRIAVVETTNYDTGNNTRVIFGIGQQGTIKGHLVVSIDYLVVFRVFSPKRILGMDLSQPIIHTREEGDFGKVTWLTENEQFCGVRIEASAPMTPSHIMEVKLDIKDDSVIAGDVKVISDLDRELIPKGQYSLPGTKDGNTLECLATYRKGNIFETYKKRSAEDLPCRTEGPSVRIKCTSITSGTRDKFQWFDISASLINLADSPITIVDVHAHWTNSSADGWQDTKHIKGEPSWPMTLAENGVTNVTLSTQIDTTGINDALEGMPSYPWDRRAFLARDGPIWFEIILEDTSGRKVYCPIEYVMPPLDIPVQEKPDTFVLVAEKLETLRFFKIVGVNKGGKDKFIVEFNYPGRCHTLDTTSLRTMVYQAEKKNNETALLLDWDVAYEDMQMNAWALIDHTCKRVYGFKFLVVNPSNSDETLGYCRIPFYGGQTPSNKPPANSPEVKIPSGFVEIKRGQKEYPKLALSDSMRRFKLLIASKPLAPEEQQQQAMQELKQSLIEHIDHKFEQLHRAIGTQQPKSRACTLL